MSWNLFDAVNARLARMLGRGKDDAGIDLRKNQRVHDEMRGGDVRVYGHSGTIHGSEQLDVEVTARGEVVAVWFRCQQLPFRQGFADHTRAIDMRKASAHAPRLVAVEVIDR